MTTDQYWQAFLKALSEGDTFGAHRTMQIMAKISRAMDEQGAKQ